MKLGYLGNIYNLILEYGSRVKLFTQNARLYLLYVVITGAAIGVYRLLFNFYVLSLGYDEALLGRLVTVNSMTAMLVALPVGYMADRLGRKTSLIISGVITSLSIFLVVIAPRTDVFYVANMMSGLGQSLAAVTMSPFMMENSGERERTYLFSFSSGL